MRVSRLQLTVRRLAIPFVIAAVSATITACGGSSNSSDTSGSSHHTHHTTGTASTTTTRSSPDKTTTSARTTATATTHQTTTGASTATSTRTTAGTGGGGLNGNGGQLSECGVTDLSAQQLSSQGAAGTMVAAYVLTNTGSSSCWTFGYPGIGFLSGSQQIPTYPRRVTRDIAGNVGGPRKITLGAGQQASFRITISQVSSGGGGDCENADALLITPPNSRASLHLTLHSAVAVCGSATVTPMLTGTSANPQ